MESNYNIPQSDNLTVQSLEERPSKANNTLLVVLSLLLFIAILFAGFFAYQTQVLVKELQKGKQPVTDTTPYATSALENEMPTPVADSMDDWKSYTNTTYGFSFKYPKNFVNKGVNSGPYTGGGVFLYSFSDPKTLVENTDSPFDGISLYYQNLETKTFESFISMEKYSMDNSPMPVMKGAKESKLPNKGIALTVSNRGYYYYPSKDGKGAIVFSVSNVSQEFDSIVGQILFTFSIHKVSILPSLLFAQFPCGTFICMESTLNPMQNNVVRRFDNTSSAKKNVTLGVVSVVVVLAGIGTGYLLSGVGKKTSGIVGTNNGTIVSTKTEAGIADESKFSTTTDGVLEEGGISGEGTYHLVRGSGPSQYAYLTSSAVDLSTFVGKKVQVWGDTISGKKAGWLIDVGKIKVVEGE